MHVGPRSRIIGLQLRTLLHDTFMIYETVSMILEYSLMTQLLYVFSVVLFAVLIAGLPT